MRAATYPLGVEGTLKWMIEAEPLPSHLGLFDEHDPNAGQPDVPALILPPGSKMSIT